MACVQFKIGGRKAFVSFVDTDTVVAQPCAVKPSFKHTPAPRGFLDWHEWARLKGKTHRQVRCPHCALWAIWVPKKKRRRAASPETEP